MSEPRFGRAPEAPKRFYKDVSSEAADKGFVLTLDGKSARTPARAPLAAPTKALGEAVAAEWAGQGERIDRLAMPLTRLLTTAVDRGEPDGAAWRDLVLSFLASDLLCYRAEGPEELIDRQNAAWTPYLEAFESRYGARLALAAGIVAVEQPEATLTAVGARLQGLDVGSLVAAKAATEITGSAVLGLAATLDGADAEETFAASRVDEAFQAEKWGIDGEAAAREAALKLDFVAACRFANLAR
ncbi:MAG: ATP12 family protein [Pseudomonadota bacterium]